MSKQGWIPIESREAFDQLCESMKTPLYLTIENKDGGRKVVVTTRPENLWKVTKAVAWMPCNLPEPFGGTNCPIDPAMFRYAVHSGLTTRAMATKFKIDSVSELHAIILRNAPLKEIWQNRHANKSR